MSCLRAKPRLRRSDNCTNDRKASRLCIHIDVRAQLLDPSNWPYSIVASEWFFKSHQPAKRSRDTPYDKRHASRVACWVVVSTSPLRAGKFQLKK